MSARKPIGKPYDPAEHDVLFWKKCLSEGMHAEFTDFEIRKLGLKTKATQNAYCQQKLEQAQEVYAQHLADREAARLEELAEEWEALAGPIAEGTEDWHALQIAEQTAHDALREEKLWPDDDAYWNVTRWFEAALASLHFLLKNGAPVGVEETRIRPTPAKPLGRLTHAQSVIMMHAARDLSAPVVGEQHILERLFLAGMLYRDTAGAYHVDDAGLQWLEIEGTEELAEQVRAGDRHVAKVAEDLGAWAAEAQAVLDMTGAGDAPRRVAPLPHSLLAPAHAKLVPGEVKRPYRIVVDKGAQVWQTPTKNGVLHYVAMALRWDPTETGTYPVEIWVEVDRTRLWVKSSSPDRKVHKDFLPLVNEFEEMAGHRPLTGRTLEAGKLASHGPEATARLRPLGAKALAAIEVLKANPGVPMSVLQVETKLGMVGKSLQGILSNLAKRPGSNVHRAVTFDNRRGFVYKL